MASNQLTTYSNEEYSNLSQFQQEEITNNFKQAILYKMKEKNLDIEEVAKKMNESARELSIKLNSDTVNYETHAALQHILAVVNSL